MVDVASAERFSGVGPGGCPTRDAGDLLEPHLHEELGGTQRAVAALANQQDGAISRQLVEAIGEVGLREIDSAWHVALRVLDRLAHIEQDRAWIAGLQLLETDLVHRRA